MSIRLMESSPSWIAAPRCGATGPGAVAPQDVGRGSGRFGKIQNGFKCAGITVPRLIIRVKVPHRQWRANDLSGVRLRLEIGIGIGIGAMHETDATAAGDPEDEIPGSP